MQSIDYVHYSEAFDAREATVLTIPFLSGMSDSETD